MKQIELNLHSERRRRYEFGIHETFIQAIHNYNSEHCATGEHVLYCHATCHIFPILTVTLTTILIMMQKN